MTTYAGHWGPEALITTAGTPYLLIAYTVFVTGTSTPATLYADRTKGSTVSNPGRTTDAKGNASFFADPGAYDISILGVVVLPGITVGADDADLAVPPGTYVPVTETVRTVATAGAAQTLPGPATATIHRLTLTAASCAITLPAAAAGQSFTLVLVQDATGSRVVTYTAAPKWAGGTAPTLSTGANKIDYLSFVCVDGTNWVGFVAALDVR